MSTGRDEQIEYWIGHIRGLVEEKNDLRPKREKLNDALDLQSQIHERMDALNVDDSYLLDVVTRVGNLIEELVNK